jgi:hypothetical protein
MDIGQNIKMVTGQKKSEKNWYHVHERHKKCEFEEKLQKPI